ncbi:MAG: T9SS type A sorting domain-containing protein [Bacteroidetes bacterium]|nr:T9SS type A sorting domain-containing protein [Bacteroidota bacterium]
MKRLVYLFLLTLLFCSADSFADSTFVTTLKIGKLGGAIREMKFVNSTTGFCCGDDISFNTNIFIAKTTDAGNSWQTVTPPGLTRGLTALEFINANTGVVVGNAGLILRTTNGGTNWSTIDISPYTGDISDITFSGTDTAYACGASVTGMATNTVFKSVNGGVNWTMLNTNCTSSRSMIEVFNNQTLVCAGNSGVIIRSTNGGTTWDSLRFGTQAFNGLKKAGSSTVWAVGNSQVVYKSTNQGLTFTLALDNGPSPLYSVDFLDSLRGFIVGSNGVNYITSNGGTSWDSLAVSTLCAQVLFSACYKSSTEIFASGQQGTIMKSSNGGTVWDYVESSNRFHSIDINGSIPTFMVAVGWRGAIIKSANSGSNWTFMKAAQGFELYDVKVFDANNFYICGGGGTFGITTNGGISFTYRNTPVVGATNRTMYWFNLNEGYCAGDNGELYYTTNAGTTWTSQLSWGASNNDIEDITFIDNNTGYVSGQLGRIAKTTNRSTWDSTGITHPSTQYVWEMKYISHTRFYAGSQNGCIYGSTNGGATWALVNDTTGLSGVNVYSFDYQFGRGIAVGTKGKVFRLQDPSFNWILSQSNVTGPNGTTIDLWAYRMITVNGGYMCGYQGGLFYIGISPPVNITKGTEVVSEYQLSQNYPNPFNPITKIKFALPKNEFVKITIFDLSGKEVQQIVNENLTAGEYETEFNAANLASGTYFYKIETNSFSDTKKMILVK